MGYHSVGFLDTNVGNIRFDGMESFLKCKKLL
jgi:hypothetical protein